MVTVCNALPPKFSAVALVSSGRKEGNALRSCVLDRSVDCAAVLKEGFVKINGIVDDDLAACVDERRDVVGEGGVGAVGRREEELGSGRDTVQDLRDRPAFVPIRSNAERWIRAV